MSEQQAVVGTVKWFDTKKGFGFLARKDGGKDVFVHYTGIVGNGHRDLAEGENVQFDVVISDRGPKAANVIKI